MYLDLHIDVEPELTIMLQYTTHTYTDKEQPKSAPRTTDSTYMYVRISYVHGAKRLHECTNVAMLTSTQAVVCNLFMRGSLDIQSEMSWAER